VFDVGVNPVSMRSVAVETRISAAASSFSAALSKGWASRFIRASNNSIMRVLTASGTRWVTMTNGLILGQQ
jgi:hypothetical protein